MGVARRRRRPWECSCVSTPSSGLLLVCPCLFPSPYKDPSRTGFGFTLMITFCLDYICKDLTFKSGSKSLSQVEWVRTLMFLLGGYTVLPTTNHSIQSSRSTARPAPRDNLYNDWGQLSFAQTLFPPMPSASPAHAATAFPPVAPIAGEPHLPAWS